MAIKKSTTKAVEDAKNIGEGLKAFCILGCVDEKRKVG